jgi:hypothetical protein
LIEEIHVEESIDFNEYFVERKELKGPKPWYIGFPGKFE